MLQLHPVYSLWNRHKTLTGSPDPRRANGTNKPCKMTEMSDLCYLRKPRLVSRVAIDIRICFDKKFHEKKSHVPNEIKAVNFNRRTVISFHYFYPDVS